MKLKKPLEWILFSLVLMLMPSIPQTAWAGSNVSTYESTKFQVDVKPEYDDPKDRTLVIYQNNLTAPGSDIIKKGTPVSFIIPKGAEIGMACEINAQGGHDCQPYIEEDIGNNQIKLTWKSTKDIAPNQNYPTYLEFYYDNGSVPPSKSFVYKFQPTFKLDTLNINVVAPKAAANFTTTPSPVSTGKDSDGLMEYHFSYQNKTIKDPLSIKIAYSKADNKPSFAQPQLGNTNIAAPSASSESNWLSKPEFWVPALLLIAALAAGLLFGAGRSKNNRGKNAKKQVTYRESNSEIVAGSKNDPKSERKKLRQMLLNGEISENTYHQLITELNSEEH